MVIQVGPDLESALIERAKKKGIAPEELAVNVLRERFLTPPQPPQSQDEWVRGLRMAASDCGVALSHEALSSEGLYE